MLELHKLSIEKDDEMSVLLTMEVDKLTRNEASRYTDKLLAKYGR